MTTTAKSTVTRFGLPKSLIAIAAAILAWFLVSEVATEAWYHWKEMQMPQTQPWGVRLPDVAHGRNLGWSNYKERKLSERERELLRFETAQSASWRDNQGRSWTVFHLTWPKDKRLNDTDIAHNPTRCLPAAGLQLERRLPSVSVQAGDGRLEFQGWRFSHAGEPIYAFLVNRRSREPERLTYSQTGNQLQRHLLRFKKVFEGNRSNPEEMLELVVQGARSDEEAMEALKIQVANLISI